MKTTTTRVCYMKKITVFTIAAIAAITAAAAVSSCRGRNNNNNNGITTQNQGYTDVTNKSEPITGFHISQITRDTPFNISWTATRETANGLYADAIRALEHDTLHSQADTALKLFKLGNLHAAIGNHETAISALSAASDRCNAIAPIAMNKIGDIHASLGEYQKATNAHANALSANDLPERYRRYLFRKIKDATENNNAVIPENQNWTNDYDAWIERQKIGTAAAAAADSATAKAEAASAADSAKNALLTSANDAFSQSKWKDAADLYRRYHAEYGADSNVIVNASRANRSLRNQNEVQRWNDLLIRHFPEHPNAQNDLWMKGWNHELGGHYAQAAAAYRRLFNTGGNREDEAHLRHSLCLYKQKQYDSVVIYMREFQNNSPRSNLLLQAMFWEGKGHAAAGRNEEAHSVWRRIAQLDPVDYHAHRAMALVGEKHDVTAPSSMMMTDAQARAWLDESPPESKKELSASDSANVLRGASLLASAQPQSAEMFLNEFERDFYGNLLLQYDMAVGYAVAGSPALSFRVAHRLSWRIPMERRHERPGQVLAIMFPNFYSDIITDYAERFKVDPLFVSAVMRQESVFNDRIVSPAGAIGLMQIMPATGRDIIARELRETFAADSLYNYRYNIRFGAYYLGKRLEQFGGDNVLALCSYNAGPNNAARWRDRRKYRDDDVFAEDIGFRETRIYVKRVMGGYWTYRMLRDMPGYSYGTPPPAKSAAEALPVGGL